MDVKKLEQVKEYCIKNSDGTYIRNKDGNIRSFRSPSSAKLYMECLSIDWVKVVLVVIILCQLVVVFCQGLLIFNK